MQMTDTYDRELAREVLEVHRKLRDSLGRLEKLTLGDSISKDSMNNIKRVLPYFRDRLISHFQIAESHGFFEDMLALRPDLNPRVDQFIEENGQLTAQVNDLCALVAQYGLDPNFSTSHFQQAFHAFDRKFNDHESTKIDLVQEAYNTDFGR